MTTPYDILRHPIVTEKSNYLVGKLHQYAFVVDSKSTKTMVKDAVEAVFKVKVLKVNIINTTAKRGRKRSRRLLIRNSAYKKAIVTLSPEDRIQFFEGVE